MRVFVYHAHRQIEEAVASFGAGVTDSFEPQCGCRKLNLGPLEELLTAEPSCWASVLSFKNV